MEADEDQKTIWCGNLSDKVTEEILYELFLQAGPVRRVKIPKDKDGRQQSYGFVTFKHIESVRYAITLLEGISLYERRLNLKPRQRQDQSLDRNVLGPGANQIMLNNHMVKDMHSHSPNRGYDHNNSYGYNDGYNGGNNRNRMKHDHRGNSGKGYHNSNGRYNSPNNKRVITYHIYRRNRH